VSTCVTKWKASYNWSIFYAGSTMRPQYYRDSATDQSLGVIYDTFFSDWSVAESHQHYDLITDLALRLKWYLQWDFRS